MERDRRWILNPLIAGRRLNHDQANGKEDGRTSATLLMCIVISAGVVLQIGYWIPLPDIEQDFQRSLLPSVVVYKIVCLSMALLIMLWYFVRAETWQKCGALYWDSNSLDSKGNGEGENGCVQNTGIQQRQTPVHHASCNVGQNYNGHTRQGTFNINILGVFLFGSGKFLLLLVYTMEIFECLDVRYDVKRKYEGLVGIRADYDLLVYYIISMVFTAVQMGFLKKFQSAVFRNSSWFQYTIIILFFVNILQWSLDIIDDFFRAKEDNSSEMSLYQGFTNNTTQHEINCLSHTTSLDKFMEKADPFMGPFKLEFSFMSLGIIFNIWCSLRDVNVYTDCSIVEQMWTKVISRMNSLCTCLRADPIQEIGNGTGVSQERLILNDDDDNAAGGDSRVTSTSVSSENTSPDGRQTSGVFQRISSSTNTRPRRIVPRCGIGLVTGIISSLILMVLGGLLADPDEYVQARHIYAFYGYRIAQCIPMILCSWYGFRAIRQHNYLDVSLQPDETLLIISVTGEFLFRMFDFIAVAGSPATQKTKTVEYPEHLPALLGVFAASNIIAAYIQSVFILTAMKYRPNDSQNARVLVEIVTFLLINNLGIWCLDSFLQVNPNLKMDPLESWFYENVVWYIVSHLILPLCIFFRFHSFVLSCEIFAHFKDHEVNEVTPDQEDIPA